METFILILKSFACGIAFAVGGIAGGFLGAILMSRVTRKDIIKVADRNAACEARLTESLDCHKRIADVLEKWWDKQAAAEFHGEKP